MYPKTRLIKVNVLMIEADLSSCRCSRILKPVYYHQGDPVKLTDIAARLDCVLKGNGDAEIAAVAGIDEAKARDLTFVSNPKYAAKARTTQASAVIVAHDVPERERTVAGGPLQTIGGNGIDNTSRSPADAFDVGKEAVDARDDHASSARGSSRP